MRHVDDFYKDYFTKNRGIMLVEYDDDENIIDIKEFDGVVLSMFLFNMWNAERVTDIMRRKYREQFTEEELKLINKIIVLQERFEPLKQSRKVEFFTDDDIELFKKVLREPVENIKFAFEIADPHGKYFNLSPGVSHSKFRFDFFEAIDFINSRPGIYYTTNSEGQKVRDFVDRPTLSQYSRRLENHGEILIFLSFKDWKEYIVNESDLI